MTSSENTTAGLDLWEAAQSQQQRQPPPELTPRNDGLCSVPGCGLQKLAKGLCRAHYERLTRGRGIQPERAIGDKRGAYNPKWKGGIITRPDGRVMVYAPEHPNTIGNSPYVLRYRLEKERQLGRFLTRREIVHHVDESVNNDVPTNTEVMTRTEHNRIHRTWRRWQREITFNGQTKSVREWAQTIGITTNALYQRFYAGWSIERALANATR